MLALFAEPFYQGWGIGQLAIAIIVVAMICDLVWIGLKAMGVSPPPAWAVQALWVLAIGFFIIVAIRPVMSM